ncbi:MULTISPECIES: TVP38/TMEM64 family protein [Pseudanabaena]|uniref:TVP38/TMEM64 family membrane protein n=2 Tax=Pseudanabaena TaxID=1152 RepID=L8N4F7_9CYAN|nr:MULTISPECIES: TVP38/TMEM64 family protein [Pseudanabaena]ELS33595.1 SNARE associated Golgi family protein [Pseudanabaena biceps PCC 7429]MDG3494197.1 TVP38/TMEM64 family protein [Pseudanabaena catenata USMAC16]
MDHNKKILIGIVCVCTIASGWFAIIHIDWLSKIQDVVQASGAWGDMIFVVAYAIATLLILPVTAFNIAGGALYGGVEGLLLTSMGALLSALLGFMLARSLGSRFMRLEERWSNVGQGLMVGGIAYSFASRLFPLIPYGVVSIAAGLSPIRQRDYLIGTLLGTPLGIAPFVFLGSTGVQMSSNHDVLPLLASSLGLALLIAASTWYQHSQKVRSADNTDNKTDQNIAG